MSFPDSELKRLQYLLGYNGDPPCQVLGPQGIETFDLLSLLQRNAAAEAVITDAVTNVYVTNPNLVDAWKATTQPPQKAS